MGGSDVHDMSYYGKCMVGGILSCGLTHMAMCPIDIIKVRKQVRSFNAIQINPSCILLKAIECFLKINSKFGHQIMF